jgi:exodeoxyribonuclease-5
VKDDKQNHDDAGDEFEFGAFVGKPYGEPVPAEPTDPEPVAEPAPALTFSPQQDEAMAAVRDWLVTRSKPVFRLFGFAGTGKTTLAKHLARTVNGKVLFAAYTGKAAHVMRRKGCDGASTIHQLLYKPIDGDEEKIAKTRKAIEDSTDAIERIGLKRELDELLKPKFGMQDRAGKRAKLIVIDECSMVSQTIGQDLLRLGIPILVLGDPAQLPPVDGGGYFTEQAPDVLLDQIHRQAEGSGILKLATAVRTGRAAWLATGTYGDEESCVISRSALDQFGNPLAFDQILVGTHKTRRIWNNRIRTMLGRSGFEPVPGDKLVCLKNDHNNRLMNGELWTCRECQGIDSDRIRITIESEDEPGRIVAVDAVRHFFQGREEELKLRPVNGARFDFGYALTVHKGQGSQWDKVLLINEANAFRRPESPDTPWRWLYTGITRAAKQLVVAQ